MKRIITILVLVVAFSLLIGVVSAEDLVEHDFNGHFTLQVPGNYWMSTSNDYGGYNYENGNNVKITYYTLDNIHKRGNTDFEDYINDLVDKGLKPMGNDGDIAVYKNNDKYTVFIHSDDEIYAITDPDLDEAKAIAKSANFKTKTSNDNNKTTKITSNNTSNSSNSTGDLERVNVANAFTINAPKGSEFDNGSIYDGYWTVFGGSKNKVLVYYTEKTPSGRQIDDAYYKEFMANVTSSGDYDVFEDGNVTIVDGVHRTDATHIVYIHGDGKMATVSSDSIDLSKEMAKSIDFIR